MVKAIDPLEIVSNEGCIYRSPGSYMWAATVVQVFYKADEHRVTKPRYGMLALSDTEERHSAEMALQNQNIVKHNAVRMFQFTRNKGYFVPTENGPGTKLNWNKVEELRYQLLADTEKDIWEIFTRALTRFTKDDPRTQEQLPPTHPTKTIDDAVKEAFAESSRFPDVWWQNNGYITERTAEFISEILELSLREDRELIDFIAIARYQADQMKCRGDLSAEKFREIDSALWSIAQTVQYEKDDREQKRRDAEKQAAKEAAAETEPWDDTDGDYI